MSDDTNPMRRKATMHRLCVTLLAMEGSLQRSHIGPMLGGAASRRISSCARDGPSGPRASEYPSGSRRPSLALTLVAFCIVAWTIAVSGNTSAIILALKRRVFPFASFFHMGFADPARVDLLSLMFNLRERTI